jgi:hypothetical protein
MPADLEPTSKEPAAVPRDLISREVARRRTFGIISHPDARFTSSSNMAFERPSTASPRLKQQVESSGLFPPRLLQ